MIRTPIQRKAPLKAGPFRGLTQADMPPGVTLRRVPLKKKRSRPKMTPARKNAKGQPCTLRFPGCYPGPENEQVQLCHLRMLGGGGTGYKPHDSEAVFGCTSCHNLLDGRDRLISELAHEFTWERILRALVETMRLQREAGVLTYRGES